MPRRPIVIKRRWDSDSIYNSVSVTRFVNNLMKHGQKEKAAKVFYKAMEIIQQKTNQSPIKLFQAAIKNTAPVLEVWSRRIGGATFMIPRTVRSERRFQKAVKWIIEAARNQKKKPIHESLAEEIILASQQEGEAYKKKIEQHKIAENNKAFTHFGWWGKKKAKS